MNNGVAKLIWGKWENRESYLDFWYDGLATKLINFANEVGRDPYGRAFVIEPIIDFVIAAEIWDKSADYIYRHFCYNLVKKREQLNVKVEELKFHISEFEKGKIL